MNDIYDCFYDLAKERYSVRKFSRKPVESDKVEKILRAGILSPTAHNNQPQKILVLNSGEALEKLKKCTTSHYGCTLAMLVCCDKDECWRREYDGKLSAEADGAIVTTHMMLAAQALGIGSTWVMHFIPEAVREKFALPESYEPVSILVMGYPDESAAPSPRHGDRKELSEEVFYNSFEK